MSRTADTESELADLADAIMHAARLIRSCDQAAETVVPLSMIEAAVLEYVDRNPGCRPSDVAHELRMRSSNFSAALRALEKQGFVERRTGASDGRTANLFVTALARENITIVRSRRAALLAGALGTDTARIAATRDLLDRLRHAPQEVLSGELPAQLSGTAKAGATKRRTISRSTPTSPTGR